MAEKNTPWRLAIGELFAPERTAWPHNSFELRYFDGTYLLQICEASPSAEAIRAFRHGDIHLGLHFEQGVIFFLFRIAGSWAWSDQAFTIHLVPGGDRAPGDAGAQHFVPLSMVLVDASTGRVAALRMVTMSPRFATAFQTYMERQRVTPFTPDGHDRAIKAVYAKYPTSKALAGAALLRERAGSSMT